MTATTRLVYGLFGALLLGVSFSASAQISSSVAPELKRTARQLDSLRRAAYLYQQQRTQDPALGRVPTERLATTPPVAANQRQARSAATPVWTERGPQGVTGTIRTLMADPLDPNRRRIWAGSLTAGLWVNGDINNADSVWRCVSDGWDNRAVSAIAADSANPQVRYAATGDLLSTMSAEGTGFYKSTNGGGTWTKLSATVPTNGTTALQSAFRRVSKLVVGRGSNVFAATQNGIVRSADGGATWQFTLAPQQSIGAQPVANGDDRMTDLELHRDGLLYAATGTGRLFRSLTTAGTSWTEVTPPSTAPYTGTRTEIALGTLQPTGPQVIYAINVAYDAAYGGYTTRWLRRSTDGARNWQTLTKPTNPSYPTDDFTLGYGDMYLTMSAAPDDINTINITAFDQLYRSTDGGRTWLPGRYVDRTTALLQTPSQRTIWGGEVAIRHAAQMLTLARQGFTEAQNGRSKGFGGLAGTGHAMRNTAGSTYRLIGSSGDPGLVEVTGSGAGSTVQVSYPAYPLRPFNDQDQPTLQVATTPGDGFLWRNTAQSTAWTYAATPLATGNTALIDVADYDSRNSTLFYWAGNYLRATLPTDGTTNVPTFAVVSATLPQPTALQVGAAPNTLYVATIDTKLYRLTNTHQESPTQTAIDAGAFPTGSHISSIGVGATDNELVVTLANYGVKSVWYTTNGGQSWVSKDEPTHGLPDLPVYDVLLNPTNRKQAMLATERGVWVTDDLTAANPAWTFGSPSAPLIRTTQLAYRAIDGLVAAMTTGRGVWETGAWAIAPPAVPALLAGRLTQTAVCAGSTVPVAFTLTNGNNLPVQVRLSDAQGNFVGAPVLTSSATSPIAVTLPTDALHGTRYRLRLEVPDFDLTTLVSQTLTIGDLSYQQPRLMDRRNNLDPRLRAVQYTDGYICPGDTALLYIALPNRSLSASATYRWANDGVVVTGANSATLLTSRTGTYSFTVTEFGCQATAATDFLLKATNTPDPSVINPTPDDGPICTGTSAPLLVDYLGRRAAYQWSLNGAALPGATSAVFSATQTGTYTYALSLSGCAATAPPLPLTFGRTILASPIGVVGDVAPALCGSLPVQLYATRQPDNTTYQWLRDGLPVAGQTTPSLAATQPGFYALRVQRGTCQAVSAPLAVTASSQLSTGFYYYGSTTVCAGEALTLYAKRYDQSLQWMRDGADIPDATDLSYDVTESGAYTLRATAGGCSGTAVAVSVVMSQTIAPLLVASERCASVDLSTQDYPSTGTTRFVWRRNGQVIDADGDSFRTVTDSGTYSLSVTNGTCGGVSQPISLTIGKPTPPRIQANGVTVRCPNSAVELQLLNGPYTVWRRNGTALPNANNDRLVATEAGVYTLLYAEGTCTTESNALTVAFGQPTSATLTGRTLVQPGQSATLAVGLSGLAPWSFTLSDGQTVAGVTQNPFPLVVAPTGSTSYSLVGVANHCGVGAAGGQARVFVGGADVSLSSWISRRQTAVGTLITQTVRVDNHGPDTAEGLVLTNRLPSGVAYPGSASGTVGGVSSYTVGTLAAGQSMTYSIGLRTDRAGTFANAVEVSAADVPDPDSQPGTGTSDGEDDATQADWRTTQVSAYYAASPNPTGRLLPTVQTNQPTPAMDRADLSLALSVNRRVAARNVDTVRVVVSILNRGGLGTANVRVGLTVPNGQFSTDNENWFSANGNAMVSISFGHIAADLRVTRTLYWIPSATGAVWGEITNSPIADPNSTPNNRATRPGEDDEAMADVRVR